MAVAVAEPIAMQILKFVGEKAATAAVSFFTNKSLAWIEHKILGQPKTCEDVLRTMRKYQEELLSEVKNLFAEMEWESTLVEEFGPEENIRNFWSWMVVISQIQSEHEREKRLQSLYAAVLDINQGAIKCLQSLHDCLIGVSSADPGKKGLLRMYSNYMYSKMSKNPFVLSPFAYIQHLNAYLDSVFVLQLMTINLFCLAEQSEEVKGIQLLELKERMEQQLGIIDQMRPKDWVDVYNLTFQQYTITIRNQSDVLYGDPPSARVWFRKRNLYNEDEEWVFRRSTSFESDGSLVIRKCGDANIAGNKLLLASDGRQVSSDGGKFGVIPLVAKDDSGDDKKMFASIWSLGQRKYLCPSGNQVALSDDPYMFELTKASHPDYIYTKDGVKVLSK